MRSASSPARRAPRKRPVASPRRTAFRFATATRSCSPTRRGVHLVDAMICLAGRIDSVYAQSSRAVRDFGLDDTTSMLFRFENGATAYLGTVIATAETRRLQVFGANGWAETGDVEHLNT